MLPLSQTIEERVRLDFVGGEQRRLVRAALQTACGANLGCSPGTTELVRLAVLKVAAGNMSTFRLAVQLAKLDWRDALAAAGYRVHDRPGPSSG